MASRADRTEAPWCAKTGEESLAPTARIAGNSPPVGADDQSRRYVPRRTVPGRRADTADVLPIPQQFVNARALPDGRPTPSCDIEQGLVELGARQCQRLAAGIRAGKALAGRSDELHPAEAARPECLHRLPRADAPQHDLDAGAGKLGARLIARKPGLVNH